MISYEKKTVKRLIRKSEKSVQSDKKLFPPLSGLFSVETQYRPSRRQTEQYRDETRM